MAKLLKENGVLYDFKPFQGGKHFTYNWIFGEGMPQPTGVTNIWILGTEQDLMDLINLWNSKPTRYKYFI